jgi:two-component system response regulator NreC
MSKLRVLLADGHEVVRDGLAMLINVQPDMEVVAAAADGPTAVDLAQQSNPDVVVMDLSMPGMSGFNAIVSLRQCRPPFNVLALTRYMETGYLHRVITAGAAGYVLKQSRAGELLRGIRAVARGGRYVDAFLTAGIVREHGGGRPGAEMRGLSARQEEVLRLIALGYSNKDVADRLGISAKTVEAHRIAAMQKIGMNSRVDLVRFARFQGWFETI